MYQARLIKSKRKNKRYMVEIIKGNKSKKIHFGSKNGSTYIDHKDAKKKRNYILRHSKLNEDWKDPTSGAGYWARWLLWSKPSLDEALDLLESKGIEFIY